MNKINPIEKLQKKKKKVHTSITVEAVVISSSKMQQNSTVMERHKTLRKKIRAENLQIGALHR